MEQLRRKFLFASSLAAQSPDPTQIEDGVREFFKQRTIQRQHAETVSSSGYIPPEESASLCRRHRLGALPDVEALNSSALLMPLFQLASTDFTNCGPILLGLVLEGIITSISEVGTRDTFLKELGGALASLLYRGQGVCFSLIWNLGGLDGRILTLFPDPNLLATSAISMAKASVGALILEEAFCAAARQR